MENIKITEKQKFKLIDDSESECSDNFSMKHYIFFNGETEIIKLIKLSVLAVFVLWNIF